VSAVIFDAFVSELQDATTGLKQIPEIVQQARHACRLQRLTPDELRQVCERAKQREAELQIVVPVTSAGPKQKTLF
jgi:hypothetical protein